MLSGGRIRHWMCCWKAVLTSVGTLKAGDCRSRGRVSTQFTRLNEKPPDGCKKIMQPQGPNICGQNFGQECRMHFNEKEKQHWAMKEAEARQCLQVEGHLFRRSRRHGVQGHHENRAQKVGVAHGISHALQDSEETCGENKPNTLRSKHACVVEAHESTRQRVGKTQQKDHEDRIARKRFNLLRHYNLVHKFIRVPQAMQVPDAKATVVKEWEKSEHCWDSK